MLVLLSSDLTFHLTYEMHLLLKLRKEVRRRHSGIGIFFLVNFTSI